MTLPLPRTRYEIIRSLLWAALLVIFPLVLAMRVLGLRGWDLSVPLIYRNADDIWQLTLTKVLQETGWILTNPYLGAPEVASWHHNAAAQTSALHSVLMLALSPLVHDAVQLQQVYYLLNFPLICLTSFVACRLLGISRLPAFCAGLLFAFTTFRIDEMLYAFLTNYFMLPLALVAAIWVLSGKFAAIVEEQERPSGRWQAAARLLRTREFALGLLFVALTAASDGYYAFFTLLLLGFSAFVRVLLGDWRRPLSLLPVGIYIFALMAVSLSLALPLHNYKNAHRNEFYPNGIEDSALTKQSFEAEVYSSTLKMMIAPIQQHHIERLGRFGKWVVETSDGARKFKNGRTLVPLGTLGSLLFVMTLVMLAVPALRRNVAYTLKPRSDSDSASPAFVEALLSLSLFIFLCSILGGIGTLVALVFPTIRAYDRFPLFLICGLYLWGAWYMTLKLRSASGLRRAAWIALIVFVTAVALYDQIPRDARKGNELSKAQFLAERRFVQKVETVLQPNAMVYQYPYSQYLRESKYYGWGSFSHIRPYLHSHQLHWSNGGAKNSPGDDWNLRTSQLPFSGLLAEVESIGFKGLVIDRTVVKAAEYEGLRNILLQRGDSVYEDEASKFSFVKLRDPGFLVTYEPDYKQLGQIEVTNGAVPAADTIPQGVEAQAFRKYMNTSPMATGTVIARASHPELFVNAENLTRGMGDTAILPITDMVGQMQCAVRKSSKPGAGKEAVLTLTNQSQFDWRLNQGSFPLRIGAHTLKADGTILRWDGGFRIDAEGYVKRGTSIELTAPLDAAAAGAPATDFQPDMLQFELVQDGNAWFNTISCRTAAN